jgi:hypothetical protein
MMKQAGSVSPNKRLAAREVPRWLIAVIAVVGAVILVYWGGQALLGREGEPGPRKKVYPGMYDLRAEVAKMRAANQAGGISNGH